MQFSRLDIRTRLARTMLSILRWGSRQHAVSRLVFGILFTVGGLLGFLPLLGFWMLPIGIALIGLSLPGLPLLNRPVKRWMSRLEARVHPPLTTQLHQTNSSRH